MVDATLTPLAAETEENLLTLDEYLALQAKSEVGLEIIDGELKGKNMPGGGGGVHVHVGKNVFRPLDAYVQQHPEIGEVYGDGLTFLMKNVKSSVKNSYIPDVCFIRTENMPADWNFEKPHPGVPNLAIEITSPGDSADEIAVKIKTYLDKGTGQVWILSPRNKTLDQHYKDAAGNHVSRLYSDDQSIDASALFPSIEGLTLAAIFKLPDRLTAKK